MFGVLCGTLITSLLLSCNGSNKNDLKSVVISTSGCFKTCPILDVKLDKNVVYYNLIGFNNRNGVYKYELSEKDKFSLDSLMSVVPLNSLKPEYASYKPDVQVYNTSFLYKDKSQEVFFFENEAPNEYTKFINFILNLKSKAQIKIDTVLEVKTRGKVKTTKIKVPQAAPADASMSE